RRCIFMADVNEKRTQQSTGQQAGQQGGQQGPQGGQQSQSTQPSDQQSGVMQARGQGPRGGRMARRGLSVPSVFALSPGAALSFSPFELMRRFTDEMDRVFEDFGLARGPEFGAGEIEAWAPSVEVFERDNNLVVRAELPGMEPDDVRIQLTDEGLVIEGDRTRGHEERRGGVYRSEIAYGHFHRLIPLPEGVNVEQAQARINNGVLEIMIPMAEARRQPRNIPISGQTEAGAAQAAQTAGQQAQTASGGSGKR